MIGVAIRRYFSSSRVQGLIRSYHHLSVDNFHRIGGDPVSRNIQRVAGGHVILPAVAAASHDLAVALRGSERHSVVKATIVDRVDISIDVEERDVLALDCDDRTSTWELSRVATST